MINGSDHPLNCTDLCVIAVSFWLQPDSEVAQAGRSLEGFFTSKLKEVFPDRVFPVAEADSDSDEYDEAYRTAEGGFPWPERREQCHRKRKRRHSLKSRRNHF